MGSTIRGLLVVLLLSLALVQAENVLTDLGDRQVYSLTKSDYSIQTDASPEILSQIEWTIQLEDAFLQDFFKTTTKLQEGTTTIYIFNSEQEYRSYVNKNYPDSRFIGGGYAPSQKIILTYNWPNVNRTAEMIKHEWTHRFFDFYLRDKRSSLGANNYYTWYPIWFEEGIADYTKCSDVDENVVGICPWHAEYLYNQVQNNALKSVASLISDQVPYGHNVTYPEYWGLVYFFIHYNNGQYLPLINQLTADLKENKLGINQDFLNNFASPAQVQKEWEQFILQEFKQYHSLCNITTASHFEQGNISWSYLTHQGNIADYCTNHTTLLKWKCDPDRRPAYDLVDCSQYQLVCEFGRCGEAFKIPEELLTPPSQGEFLLDFIFFSPIFPLLMLIGIVVLIVVLVRKKR